mmetsp:Transcript_104665/g.239957  ORF Transcript_104665/g.239957 Transcript_104665/m.239957 type:complete len:692 (+) Transcript_104665:32-2107(+)
MAGDVIRGWYWLGWDQKFPMNRDHWQAYEQSVSFQLSVSYDEMRRRGVECGRLLDVSAFTDPPQPYEVWMGRKVTVNNPRQNYPDGRFRETLVAGYPLDIWDGPGRCRETLPAEAAALGSVVGYFYQIHKESVPVLEALERYLMDETGQVVAPDAPPRRRVVILVEWPASAFDNRFRYQFARRAAEHINQPITAVPDTADAGEDADGPLVTQIDSEGGVAYEWWIGPVPLDSDATIRGRWKRYHPHISAKIENSWQRDREFRNGSKSIDIDGERYMMACVTSDVPYDRRGEPSLEVFPPDHVVTVSHPCYSDLERQSGGCLVQHRKGNPKRRRPVRRVLDAAEIARRGIMTEAFCSVCLSDNGQLTGCEARHVICPSCLRAALRSVVGDVMVVGNLICGCFSQLTRKALLALAERADVSLQDTLQNPPARDSTESLDLRAEVGETMRQFSLPTEDLPANLYVDKMRQWFTKVHVADRAHLYHPCRHPDCADLMENWKLISEFEEELAANGGNVWTCPAGHENCVLPSASEVRDMNRNLLTHPEYYTMRADYSIYENCPLRRYRLCPGCLSSGILMMAVHGGECKQWPGYGRGHHHTFCFACARLWGNQTGNCNHYQECRDPGIQQVRLTDTALVMGFVDGELYQDWLNGRVGAPPPTCFDDGSYETGPDRQRVLGMEDRAALLAESRQGIE